MTDIIVINNIIAPYRVDLFNKLKVDLNFKKKCFKVLFLSKTESSRNWNFDKDLIAFDFEILPVIFQIRNLKTATSDIIINYGFMKYLFANKVLIFGYNYTTYIIFIIVRKLLFKKTILFCESTLSDKTREKNFFSKLKSIFMRNFFSSFIVPGHEAKKFILSYGVKRKIFKAPNAIKPFEKVSRVNKNKDYITLIYVGRLSIEKNIEFFLKNVPTNENFLYKVIIVGDGIEKKKLQSLQLNYPIEFRGFEQSTKLAKSYKQADIIVLPSISEPWGFVINEAISFGIVPIVSDKVGCRHELVKGNGEIFKHNNPQDFREKLKLVSKSLIEYKIKSLNKSKQITLDLQSKIFVKAILET